MIKFYTRQILCVATQRFKPCCTASEDDLSQHLVISPQRLICFVMCCLGGSQGGVCLACGAHTHA